jgi:hypothetical protein
MKFSTCYALIEKRGFFLYQNLFAYDEPVGHYLTPWTGNGVVNRRLFTRWFESHIARPEVSLTFTRHGLARSRYFGYFLVARILPHTPVLAHYTWHIIRLFKVMSNRGRRHSQGLPTRGQRTHSNSATTAVRGQAQTSLRLVKLGLVKKSSEAARHAKILVKLRKERSAIKHRTSLKKPLSGKAKNMAPAKSKKTRKVDVWR